MTIYGVVATKLTKKDGAAAGQLIRENFSEKEALAIGARLCAERYAKEADFSQVIRNPQFITRQILEPIFVEQFGQENIQKMVGYIIDGNEQGLNDLFKQEFPPDIINALMPFYDQFIENKITKTETNKEGELITKPEYRGADKPLDYRQNDFLGQVFFGFLSKQIEAEVNRRYSDLTPSMRAKKFDQISKIALQEKKDGFFNGIVELLDERHKSFKQETTPLFDVPMDKSVENKLESIKNQASLVNALKSELRSLTADYVNKIASGEISDPAQLDTAITHKISAFIDELNDKSIEGTNPYSELDYFEIINDETIELVHEAQMLLRAKNIKDFFPEDSKETYSNIYNQAVKGFKEGIPPEENKMFLGVSLKENVEAAEKIMQGRNKDYQNALESHNANILSKLSEKIDAKAGDYKDFKSNQKKAAGTKNMKFNLKTAKKRAIYSIRGLSINDEAQKNEKISILSKIKAECENMANRGEPINFDQAYQMVQNEYEQKGMKKQFDQATSWTGGRTTRALMKDLTEESSNFKQKWEPSEPADKPKSKRKL